MSLALDEPRGARLSPALLWSLAFAAATAGGLAAVAYAPLAAYVWLIALFGVPHVLAEMRYVDERFSGRIARAPLAAFGALLAALAAVRLAGTYGYLDARLAGPLELACGAGLAFAAAAAMPRLKLLALGLGALVAYGAYAYPFQTFLIWAWIHNLTPLGFVAEALRGRARTLTLGALSIPFFVVPAIVAAGALGETSTASAFGAGAKPLSAFLPRMPFEDALPLFQAAVLSQVMHYVAVIAFLPWLMRHKGLAAGRPLAPWPSWAWFYAGLAAAGLGSLAFYAVDYGGARSAYALAAALHSWIELPVFLLALGGALKNSTEG